MKNIIAVFLLAGVAIGIGTYVMREDRTGKDLLSADRVKYLIDELTTTPERQNAAMDELVAAGDTAIPYIFAYFDDRRLLATKHVGFLNSSPKGSEKHFRTFAVSVDEVTLRYLCWHSAACDFDFKKDNQHERSVQVQQVFIWCKTAYAHSAATCETFKNMAR